MSDVNDEELTAALTDTAPDTRPTIRFRPDKLHESIEAGIAAMTADANLFKRDDALVHVSHVTREEQLRTADALIEGTPKIHRMAVATVRERLCRWARLEAADSRGKWKLATPNDHVVNGIAHRKEWPGIRPLVGIIEAPSLRPDGTVLDVPGYDASTGFIYAPSMVFGRVPDAPTREDAVASLRFFLEEVFPDFPYVIEEGRSAALAAVLTLLARPAIQGPTPAFLFDATTAGSGKTLQADIASVIATGRPASRTPFPFCDGREGDAELGKLLASVARRGGALVNFDNLDADKVRFGGQSLEACLTAKDTCTFRILGKTEDFTVSWRTVIFGSGNNVEWSRDMNRRVLRMRLESPHEDPEKRPIDSFKRPDRAFRLVEWVTEHRAELVCAALTLLRAYVVAGSPPVVPLWASFESWSQLVAGAIVWAGGPNPMRCRPTEHGEESPDKTQQRVLLREWSRLDSSGVGTGLTIKSAFALLYPLERVRTPNPAPDQWEDLRAAVEHFVPARPGASPDARATGKAFKRLEGSIVGGLKLANVGNTGGSLRWRAVRHVAPTTEGEDAARGACGATASPYDGLDSDGDTSTASGAW